MVVNAPANLSARETIVLKAVVRAARRDEPCPSNFEICGLIGCESIASATGVLQRLERKGLVKVERYQQARRVTILATGARTAEPRFMVRHWRSRAKLTRAETQDRVADAIADGHTFEAAAGLLGMTVSHVRNTFADIRRQLGRQAV